MPKRPIADRAAKSCGVFCLILLAGCTDDEIIADIASPDRNYHALVQKCPQKGSFSWLGDTNIMVSILPSGVFENCNSFVNSWYQFEGYAPYEQLEVEWLSPTELRAWHPAFESASGPTASRSKTSGPIKVTFTPNPAGSPETDQ